MVGQGPGLHRVVRRRRWRHRQRGGAATAHTLASRRVGRASTRVGGSLPIRWTGEVGIDAGSGGRGDAELRGWAVGRRGSGSALALALLLPPSASVRPPRPAPPAGGDTPVAWSPCPKVAGYQCGTLRVPLDYAHPSRGSVALAVMERPVAQSKGVIVFNPGGPGESGVLILPILAISCPRRCRTSTPSSASTSAARGPATHLDCGPSAAAASSAVAGTAAATRTFADVEHSCQASSPSLFPTVNTTTSARDMDRLRAALGVARIGYYGMSYGTSSGRSTRTCSPPMCAR